MYITSNLAFVGAEDTGSFFWCGSLHCSNVLSVHLFTNRFAIFMLCLFRCIRCHSFTVHRRTECYNTVCACSQFSQVLLRGRVHDGRLSTAVNAAESYCTVFRNYITLASDNGQDRPRRVRIPRQTCCSRRSFVA